jgi:hypothetical protein
MRSFASPCPDQRHRGRLRCQRGPRGRRSLAPGPGRSWFVSGWSVRLSAQDLLPSDFLEANRAPSLAPAARRVTAVVGFADRGDTSTSAAARRSCRGVYHKHHLPNYAVFDEKRYFQSVVSRSCSTCGVQLSVTICEDMVSGRAARAAGPGRAEILLPPASPFHRADTRSRALLATVRNGVHRRPQPGRRPGRAGLRRRQRRDSTSEAS